MSAVSLLGETLRQADTGTASWTDRRDDSPSLGSAVSALLESVRAGTLSAAARGDRWLVLRIEEALDGFDDIQQMANGDEPAPPTNVSGTAGTASILARRARALA